MTSVNHLSISELQKIEAELSACITPERNVRMNEVLENRTRYLTVAVEDVYQPHNASAVLRSCDCFGVMDVHIIENRNKYQINPDVALGASQWLTMHRYNEQPDNTVECIRALKENNYRIIATTPHERQTLLTNFDVSKGKFALFFGTEMKGVSAQVLEHADEHLRIPMYGFTESYNISVSAALCMFQVVEQLRKTKIDWSLSEKERLEIKVQWLKKQLHY
ncbi:MAG: RNA methyltransferase [Flavobacteriales bacterium]|nr:RNA methyltransferase [Flavobacteriales bacterium]